MTKSLEVIQIARSIIKVIDDMVDERNGKRKQSINPDDCLTNLCLQSEIAALSELEIKIMRIYVMEDFEK